MPEGCLCRNLLASQVPSLWMQFHITIITGSQACHCAWHQRHCGVWSEYLLSSAQLKKTPDPYLQDTRGNILLLTGSQIKIHLVFL